MFVGAEIFGLQLDCTSNRSYPTDKQVQYAALGNIDPNLFNNGRNEGLTQFIEANALHRKMEQHGHLFCTNSAGDVLLKYQGKDTSWSEIKKQIDDGVIRHDGAYKLVETYYTYQGLVTAPDISKIDLDEITLERLLSDAAVVFQHDDPTRWNSEYVISIVTHSHPAGPKKEKEHSWLRFKDPKGRILSLGLSRTKPGLSTQPGRIERVDAYEGFKEDSGSCDECDIRVTLTQWEAKLRQIVKMVQEPIVYHQIKGSCATLVTKTFNDLTNSQAFDSRVHITALAHGFCSSFLQSLPVFIVNYMSSHFVQDAAHSMDIDALKEHEIKQARIDRMTIGLKNELKERMDAASGAFARLSPVEQARIDHPYALRQKGLEIAAYRLEMIRGLQELFRRQMRDDELHISDLELKNELKAGYRENFRNSCNAIMLDLPPVGWKCSGKIPEKHPDYHMIDIESHF